MAIEVTVTLAELDRARALLQEAHAKGYTASVAVLTVERASRSIYECVAVSDGLLLTAGPSSTDYGRQRSAEYFRSVEPTEERVSDKVKIKFDLRLSVDGFEMEVDADKANAMLALMDAEGPVVTLEALEEVGLDLSGSWPDIVNASNDIEVSDMDLVLPEIAQLDNT